MLNLPSPHCKSDKKVALQPPPEQPISKSLHSPTRCGRLGPGFPTTRTVKQMPASRERRCSWMAKGPF